MSKRFVDTEIYRKAWFTELTAEQQQLWFYLCISCDIAGIWDKNYRLASFELKREISDESFSCFGQRAVHLEDNKLWIPGFITFQYGTLSPDCKPHRAVISLLQKRSIDPQTLTILKGLANPLDTVQDKDKDKDKDQDKVLGGVGEPAPISPSIQPEGLAICEIAWSSTLRHFKIDRPILSHERMKIARLIREHGHKATAFALVGMQFEQKTDNFDPARNLAIHRAMDSKLFEKFVNLASREKTKEKKSGAA